MLQLLARMGGACKGNLTIIGASGHGKVVADIAKLNGYRNIVFIDDDESIKECAGYPVVGKTVDVPDGAVFVAIENATIRKRLMVLYKDRYQPVLVHPSAIIANDVHIGQGSVIMAGAIINSGATIGRGCIINTASSIDHDCRMEDYCHIAVGAHLCGNVNVGPMTWIGAGATVSNNVDICSECTIGAGAAVVRDIDEKGIYIGVPTQKLCKPTKALKHIRK